MPAPPRQHAGTASQLIPGVRWTGRRCLVLTRRTLAFAAIAAAGTPGATGASAERPQRPLVRTIAGLVVGQKTVDQAVVRTFGRGCFVQEEGHGGGRYYTDLARRVTLHTVIGVDWATDEIELSAFVDLPPACRNAKRTLSPALSEVPIIEHGLRFGMSSSDVIGVLGRPDGDKLARGARTISYRATYDTDPRINLEYEAKFRFVGDRLTKVSLYDGE
jgi:hypothetical protein